MLDWRASKFWWKTLWRSLFQSCALLKHTALSRSGKSSVLVRVSMQIVEENKRQLCVFQEANSTGKPWLWWDFVGGYGTRCTFANNKFNDEACAKAEVEAIGLSNDKILQCMGDSRADGQHPLLQVHSRIDWEGGSGHLFKDFIACGTRAHMRLYAKSRYWWGAWVVIIWACRFTLSVLI